MRKRIFRERFRGWTCGWLVVTLWFVLAVTLAPNAALGQGTSAGGPTAGGGIGGSVNTLYAPVLVSGRHIVDVASNGAIPAADRANRINHRLQVLVDRPEAVPPFTPSDVITRSGQTSITLGGELIMDVTPSDSADFLSTPHDLALAWGGKLSRAVAEARLARQHPLHGMAILIGQSFRDMLLAVAAWLPRLAGAFVVLLLFAVLAKIASAVVKLVAGRTHMDPNLRQLARAVAHYGTWAIGLIAILSVLGFQGGSIITAFGISGFVLGFAFKDILSHFLAGLMLLVGRQLRIGDQIIVNEYEGTVERIELRALYLRTYDNRVVIIPNGDVFTSVVTSNTASPYRRREFVANIGYDADIAKAQKIALETVRDTPDVQKEPAADVLVQDLTGSYVNLLVRFYTNSARADYLKVGSECMRRVKEAFQREGISLPGGASSVQIVGLGDLAEAIHEMPTPGSNGATNGSRPESLTHATERTIHEPAAP